MTIGRRTRQGNAAAVANIRYRLAGDRGEQAGPQRRPVTLILVSLAVLVSFLAAAG